MPKYINADDIYNGMREHRFEARHITIGEFVDYLPSADVVEVIRCKDCHFYDNQNNGGLKKHGFCEIYRGFKTDDGFCDLGERKETE